jgi:hypothetical protein
VVVTSEFTATYNQPDHDDTLRNFDEFFGPVASAEEILACWVPVPVRLRAATGLAALFLELQVTD